MKKTSLKRQLRKKKSFSPPKPNFFFSFKSKIAGNKQKKEKGFFSLIVKLFFFSPKKKNRENFGDFQLFVGKNFFFCVELGKTKTKIPHINGGLLRSKKKIRKD